MHSNIKPGRLFRSEAGRGSDLATAAGGLLAQIAVDGVSCSETGQEGTIMGIAVAQECSDNPYVQPL